jgi:hypothetical protein
MRRHRLLIAFAVYALPVIARAYLTCPLSDPVEQGVVCTCLSIE